MKSLCDWICQVKEQNQKIVPIVVWNFLTEVENPLLFSDQQIAILLKRDIYLNLQEFARGLARACEVPESLVTLPIRVDFSICLFKKKKKIMP